MEKKLNGKLAVYPGTFDPLHNGHVSLVTRASAVFERVIVAVAASTPKKTLFSLRERVDMAGEVFQGNERVTVEPFDGLLVDYVSSRGAGTVVRGLRAVSDFEYEFQMAIMNRKLARHIQTIFMMTDYKWMYLSSTIIKEAAMYGGRIKGLVPDPVLQRIRRKYGFEYET